MNTSKSLKYIGLLFVGVLIYIAGTFTSRLFFNSQPPPPPVPKFFQGTSGRKTTISEKITGKTFDVKSGQSIMDAVRKANSGDLIRIYPGTYYETVYIDKDNITIQGVIIDNQWPTLDGQEKLNDAFLYSGSNITIENFKIQNYKGNGIMGQSGNNFVLRNNWVINTGVYGIFPEYGKNGLIERNILTNIEDAAIYVGMCDNIDVRFNEVYASVAGIEIENSRHALVEYNNVYDNTGGILAFITPGLPIKTCYDIIIRNNYIVNNNHKNFGAPGSIVSFLPVGTGIIIMAADDVIVENNFISGNDNIGIAIVDHKFIADIAVDPESEPNPDRIVILDNFMFNNGNNPVKEVKAAMATKFSAKGPDILAYGGGTGSCIRDINRYRTYGLDKFARCELNSTDEVLSYMLDKPVEPLQITQETRGKLTYYGVCSGCHAYNVRMIGPPVQAIQAIYKDNPQGIADYIAKPIKKRTDHPEMPKQDYLPPETRLEVAKFMLTITK
ncbi:MAG: right-handed parallel beta-helix repeat-containing protein [Bacteroidia bacterium]|nr:right-handed parallel beta-helix repeat-containing protein [Bacteroidia bacterium]